MALDIFSTVTLAGVIEEQPPESLYWLDTFYTQEITFTTEEIRTALERGDSVKLSGFGNFQLRDKPQRPGRNPKTGEEIPITARRVVTFHASQKLKAAVEQLSDASKQP